MLLLHSLASRDDQNAAIYNRFYCAENLCMEVVAADIGGTHARFALARVEDRRVVSLDAETIVNTADHPSFEAAWAAFAARLGRPAPRAASVAVAGPVAGDVLKFTNNPWTLTIATLPQQLGLDRLTLINDFAAIAHAVSHLDAGQFRLVCGPDRALPDAGAVTVIGPGTGLGVAQLIRSRGGYDVVSTEGGHMSFAPTDDFEDALLARLRRRYPHVSAERVISGPGLLHIYEHAAAVQGQPTLFSDAKNLWEAALTGSDRIAVLALERFCMCLGACAGDVALAQGARAVVIAGGLGLRLADVLPRSAFAQRFAAKGRFAPMMAATTVKLVTFPQPGLLGAAAAFAQEHAV